MHACRRCTKELSTRQSLENHYRKKKPCIVTNEEVSLEDCLNDLIAEGQKHKQHKCIHCCKLFNHRQGKSRHMRACSNVQVIHSVSFEEYNELKQRLETLEAKETAIIINNINGNINSNNTYNNITLKPFGCENTDYLTKDFLNSCILMNDIVSLIENIHLDKDHPENHNVKVKSTKQELMETYIDGKWIITDTNDTLNELINKGYRVLNQHTRKHKKNIIETEMDESEYHDVLNWLENIYEDKQARKPIKKKLLLLFLNNQTMLLGKEE